MINLKKYEVVEFINFFEKEFNDVKLSKEFQEDRHSDDSLALISDTCKSIMFFLEDGEAISAANLTQDTVEDYHYIAQYPNIYNDLEKQF